MKLMGSLLGFSLLLRSIFLVSSYGINGGLGCAACTIISGIFSQAAEINNVSLVNASLAVCDHLKYAGNLCRDTVQTLAPVLNFLVKSRKVTPDTFCYGLNFCHQDTGEEICFLFPPPQDEQYQNDVSQIREEARPYLQAIFGTDLAPNRAYNFCDLPGVRDLCHLLISQFDRMDPGIDPDGDKFSASEKWRGSNWRGRDCLDSDPLVYPGRLADNADVDFDSNCNGIWGLDERTGIPWETKLCGDISSSTARGLIMIGDSVGAHFHFPEVWFKPNLISRETFLKNSTGPILDELDWPQYSFSTGFKNITEPFLIKGPVDSLYLRMRQRNLCNHRDYQNVCRNGATSFNLVKNVENIARNVRDKPVTVLLGVFGNDVCNRFPNTLKNMTTVKQFYNNIKTVIQALENSLPSRSDIILIGLVNGSFIFDTLADRLHPIGEYHGDVHYRDVFKWFECMQISPCNGWLSESKSIRDATTQRALELSHVLKDLASSYKSKKVSLTYLSNPYIDVVRNWKKKGGEEWQLFEPVDGFHPNQIAQPLIADLLWRRLKSLAPTALGSINKFNKEIKERFGDQGGH